MNESEWLTASNPQSMLRLATGRVSNCCGCVWCRNGDGTVSLGTGQKCCPKCDNATPKAGYGRIAGDRKLRLFACAVARLMEDTPPHAERTAVIEACERIADGLPSRWGVGDQGLIGARKSIGSVWGWTWAATCENLGYGLRDTLIQMRGNAGSFYGQEKVASLLRDIIGNPYKPVTLPMYEPLEPLEHSPDCVCLPYTLILVSI